MSPGPVFATLAGEYGISENVSLSIPRVIGLGGVENHFASFFFAGT
jgi:hypothetical protein